MIRLVSGNIPDHYILLILIDLSKKLVEMDGGNLSEDAPETFENMFDLHSVFLHLEYSRIDSGFKTKAIY